MNSPGKLSSGLPVDFYRAITIQLKSVSDNEIYLILPDHIIALDAIFNLLDNLPCQHNPAGTAA